MVFTEVKQRGERKYYYRVKSVRHGEKIEKERVYMGVNLGKKRLEELEKEADVRLDPSKIILVRDDKRKETVGEEGEKKDKKLGITAKKDEFSEWFTQIMLKADLADYTAVSGSIVFRPTAYAIWDCLKNEVDAKFKKIGIKNVYFPLLIPEKLFNKEKEHVKGFFPEVAWVTHAGNTELSERLAIRPTSETIMYDSYAKWIRSWRDLPLKLNQWNNVVRWEFKHPVPFLRTREFLWNEGHTVYASKKEAEKEKDQIINIYKKTCEELLALPGLVGRKSDKEKFAGAEYTYSIEYYMPNGKAIQGPDFHYDGQNFSKAYNITFLNKDGREEYAYQNTFAITTRMLGVMFAVHSDSKGLILPPRIAPNKVVIVPIMFSNEKDKKVLKKASEIKVQLGKYGAILDDREEYKPGFKYNEWELKGIPLRIEIGPRDIENSSVVLVRRDTNKKENVKIKDIDKRVGLVLENVQKTMLKKAQKMLFENIVDVRSLEDLNKAIKSKKIALTPLCDSIECEEGLKFKTGGAKVLNIPDIQPKNLKTLRCVICGKKVSYLAYVGKSY